MYETGLEHILESYHYMQQERWMGYLRDDGRTIFLDSGAFSAYMMGVTIDLNKFVDFCGRYTDIIRMMSVLDSIGDPDGTWRNQMEMERQGVKPLPCYHYGEPTEVCDWYVKNYDYITIGGMVPITTPQLKIWLDRIWEEHLTDVDGKPKCKVHGFGLTSPELMRRYPWYSVDSSTWQALGSNGSIFMPDGKVLAVSANAAQRKIEGQHVSNLTPPQREAVERLVAAEGMPIDLLASHHSHRWTWNVWQLPRIAQSNGHATVFKRREQRLF
jgi:hypothetical protein